jgi:hypothetical protein
MVIEPVFFTQMYSTDAIEQLTDPYIDNIQDLTMPLASYLINLTFAPDFS